MRRFLGLAFVAAPLFASYTYYFSDPLTSINTSNWWQNGSLTAGSSGLTSSDGNGGSLISKVTVPSPGASQYEVKATVNLVQSGGTYVVYLRASQDALSAASASGTYYAFELQNPQITGSTCSATFVLNKRVNGVVSNLATFSSAVCSVNTNVIRGVITNNGSQITAFLNGMQYLWTSDSSIASGQPGIGVRGAPSANTITNVALGPLDTVAPTAVPAQSIRTSSFSTHIDFQWQGTTDNQDGIGLLTYQIQRNGVGLANLNGSFPTFNDTTVTAGTTYTYTIAAIDYHMNAALTQVQVRVPAAGDIDPREVGVRPTGTYWGAAGEQIDIRSGNLNYTMPLVKPMANGNWGTTFNLTYNSQNWRQDTSTNWKLGDDVGYGFGWKLQAGSLLPVYSGYWTLDHYLFTDATGAEYRLNRNNGGVWSSTEGIYVYFDSNTGILHFRDGSFWKMQCISAGTEQDAGTMYPTTIEDSNGNQIIVDYWPGTGISGSNSSARIQDIKDARKVSIYPSYAFSFNNDLPTPHLTGITNYIQTAESYTFSIPNGVAIVSPFDGTSFGTTGKLSSITQTPTSMTTSFTYNTSLEMTQMTTPYQGSISWGYGAFAYHSSRSQREVQDRYLVKALGAAQTHYTFTRDNASNGQVHASVLLDDPGGSGGGNGEKAWFFQTNTSGFDGGLITNYEQRPAPGQASTNLSAYTWAQDSAFNPYIGTVLTTLDQGKSYSTQKKTTQTLDQYGNVTQTNLYNFGNLTTTARTYTYTYLTDDNCNLGHHPCFTSYASNYIFNRLLSASVTDGTNTATLVSNTYDYNNLNDLSGLTQHDATYGTTFRSRGNVYGSTTLSAVSQVTTIDIRGNPVSTSVNGMTVTTQSSSTFNYAVPTQITANSTNETLNWSTFLAIQSDTGPNGDTASIGYDSAGRPGTSQSPYGATTYYGYNDTASPPTHTATTNGRTATTTLDGFGRTIQVDTTVGATKFATVETNYDSCACSPLGKIWRRSQSYAPGGTKYWTTYNYDGLGRTTSVVLPDNSTTSYQYKGNTVIVTDAASPSNVKTFTMDAFGNLMRVDETDPTLGAVYTTYTYDVLSHLIGVSMLRNNNYTQTRTFNYKAGTTVTGDLQSATNPETGTVTYTYDTYHRLYTKTDAKGQVFTYSRDSLGRVLYVYCCTAGSTNALRTYTYDSDATGFSHYVQGRLSSVTYAGTVPQLTDRYSYKQSGLVETKRVQVTQTLSWVNNQGYLQSATPSINLDLSYLYNDEGAISKVTYPSTNPGTGIVAGASYTYSFDSLNRASGLTDANSNSVVNNVTYGPSDELLTMSYSGTAESRGYNTLGQLTSIVAGGVNMTYSYPAGHNIGKISSQTDNISGETVQYTYDSLNRLMKADATNGPTPWGNQYAYDGWGNLTQKSVIRGTAPTLSVTADGATNRISGLGYDANGNVTSYGLGVNTMTLYYDSENHVTGGQSVAQGIYLPTYRYDAQGKRFWSWTGTTDSYGNTSGYQIFLYSPGGQKLAQYQISTYNNGQGQPNLILASSLVRSDTYFRNRLLIAQDRLASVGKYFPYGEEKGSGNPANDNWKFATYWRDSGSLLDYADQRYYSAVIGRFMMPDPSSDSWDGSNPQSWNGYSYANNDPTNLTDPEGLLACGDLKVNVGPFAGMTVSQVMTGTTGNDNLAQLIWHEDGTIYNPDLSDFDDYQLDQLAVGTAVLNQLAVDDHQMTVYANGAAVCPLGQCLNRNLSQIIYAIATYNVRGSLTHVFDTNGHMVDSQASVLKGILNTDIKSGAQITDTTGESINIGCEGVLSSIMSAVEVLSGTRIEGTGSADGLALLFWNKQSPTTFLYPGYVGIRSPRAVGHTFWGLYTTATPPPGAAAPPPPPVRIPRSPRR